MKESQESTMESNKIQENNSSNIINNSNESSSSSTSLNYYESNPNTNEVRLLTLVIINKLNEIQIEIMNEINKIKIEMTNQFEFIKNDTIIKISTLNSLKSELELTVQANINKHESKLFNKFPISNIEQLKEFDKAMNNPIRSELFINYWTKNFDRIRPEFKKNYRAGNILFAKWFNRKLFLSLVYNKKRSIKSIQKKERIIDYFGFMNVLKQILINVDATNYAENSKFKHFIQEYIRNTRNIKCIKYLTKEKN